MQIRKEIGEVAKLIPEERIYECIVEKSPMFLLHDDEPLIWVMKMKRTSLKE